MRGVTKYVLWSLAAVLAAVLVWKVGAQVLLLFGATSGSYGAWRLRSLQSAREGVEDAGDAVAAAIAESSVQEASVLAEAKQARKAVLTSDYLEPLEFDE